MTLTGTTDGRLGGQVQRRDYGLWPPMTKSSAGNDRPFGGDGNDPRRPVAM
jgi:hypothetical protein